MGFRDNEEALRARVVELESRLSSANENEVARLFIETRDALRQTERELRVTREELDRLKLAALKKPLIPPGTFQRSGAFGAALAATLAGLAALVMGAGAIARGCEHPLHAGYVVERVHHEAYTTHGEICTGSGSSRHCTPTTTHHPERWTVIVANGEREVEDDLDVERWRHTHNGDWFCVREPCPPAPAPDDFAELDR